MPQTLYENQEQVLKSMLGMINHRGPDHQNLIQKDRVGLAHARLKILDLSDEANQPFSPSDQKCALVYNGEIYNHGTLRRKLQFQDFRTHGDTETLLHGLREFGEKFIAELNGIFSFAFVDFERQQALLVRDRFGVKPLYYYKSPTTLYFASEIRSLLQIQEYSKELDHEALSEHICLLAAQDNKCIYKHIKRLEPGHYLKVDILNQTIENFQYWQVPSSRTYIKDSPDKIISDTESLLIASVQRQLITDTPLGFFLSGGLDSSLLVAIAQKHGNLPNPQCFTIQQETKGYGFENDYPFAQKLSMEYNWDLKLVHKPRMDLKTIDQILEIIEEPIPDLSALNVASIAETAQKMGVKVLVSGLGADDLFTGYRRHQLVVLYKWLRWLPFKKAQSFLQKCHNSNLLSQRIHKAMGALHEDENNFLVQLHLYEASLPSRYSSHLIKKMEKFGVEVDLIDKALCLEQISYLPHQNLLYTDKASMKYGVEVRVPYLDHELCDYVYRIPGKLKIKGLETKHILKEIAKKYLPKEIIYRKKVGFSEPIDANLEKELRHIIQLSKYAGMINGKIVSKQLLLNFYACLLFEKMVSL